MKKLSIILFLFLLSSIVFAASNATDDLLAIVYISIGLIFLAIIVVIILLIIFIILKFANPKKDTPTPKKEVKKEIKAKEETQKPKKENSKKEFGEAMKLLRNRFAAGEITKKQFEEMKEALGD
jgi:uncharacterized membrane protein